VAAINRYQKIFND